MIGVFVRRGPWGVVHATWPESARAHLRLESLLELPDAEPAAERLETGSGDRTKPVRQNWRAVLAFTYTGHACLMAQRALGKPCTEHSRCERISFTRKSALAGRDYFHSRALDVAD